jgi:hypothetical protein
VLFESGSSTEITGRTANDGSRDAELRYINLKLASLGQPVSRATADPYFLEVAGPLLRNHYQKDELLRGRLCPVDTRIQDFLDAYLKDICPSGAAHLPDRTFVLDRPGLARLMSLPATADSFAGEYLNSYRVAQGVLHNPKSDRRTTRGVFHIVAGGFPIPADKIEVPKNTFARLLEAALRPPESVMTLPFTAQQNSDVRLFVSLLMRPIVCPATQTDPVKTMETRLFAPASLVSNLDFVESIFGNGGDPYLPENDAALDVEHWTGHTGCIILAPHLTRLRKKDLGLPHASEASERQRREGMCWEDAEERYNGGEAFKVTCRDQRGVIVTIIADNYFGYCKKEVKTQISYAANLYGMAEEEHAGGALVFPSYVLGEKFHAESALSLKQVRFDQAARLLGSLIEQQPGGYASDRQYPDIFYVPESSAFDVNQGFVTWRHEGSEQKLTLRVGAVYVLPNGFRVRLEKQFAGTQWRMVGTRPRGTLLHKPCTVSGGGKSEISKSIANALLHGPIFVKDYRDDMDEVARILERNFSSIYKGRSPDVRSGRPILSAARSLGSVIQLLTPRPDYTDEHNAWVRQLPQTIRQIVFTVKRYYRPEWGDNWREHLTVDRINGFLGHELKYDDHKLLGNYLRIGYDPDGAWRIYKLRPDFHPADKVQMEDDITASVVVPRESLDGLDPEYTNPSVKLVANCEQVLFQRPDDAVHRGLDQQAEADIASPNTFLSNFEPLGIDQARAIVDHVVEYDQYSDPMKRLLKNFADHPQTGYVVSSAHARVVDGKPSKNPRYLQKRPDLADPREVHLARIAARLVRGLSENTPVHLPVNHTLPGRRNNPPDPAIGLPPLAVYSPIHYQDTPELFMDFICSLTGKSPSTTGFGSEGALTKGPFNALWPVVDLNNALVSAILTGYNGFTTSAGYVGPQFRVDHDITMLAPEIWCRMRVFERRPRYLIENGYLEKVEDFTFESRAILASRLGYRITSTFVDQFLGRIFETPNTVFSEEMLRPEKQDLGQFAAGVEAIVDAQRRVALNYFDDGSVEAACPPLRALLHIMVYGSFEGKTVDAPEVRAMFKREAVLGSEWYQERLRVKQERDIVLWKRHAAALEAFRRAGQLDGAMPGFDLEARIALAAREIDRLGSPEYLEELTGTIGADPLRGQVP